MERDLMIVKGPDGWWRVHRYFEVGGHGRTRPISRERHWEHKDAVAEMRALQA